MANFFLPLCLFSLHFFFSVSFHLFTHIYTHKQSRKFTVNMKYQIERTEKWFEGFLWKSFLILNSTFQGEWLCARKTGSNCTLVLWLESKLSNAFINEQCGNTNIKHGISSLHRFFNQQSPCWRKRFFFCFFSFYFQEYQKKKKGLWYTFWWWKLISKSV